MFKIKNPVVPIFLLLTVSVYIVLMVASCKNGGKEPGKPAVIEFPKDNSGLDSIDHFISGDQVDKYRADFKVQKDSLSRIYQGLLLPDAEAFNKRSLVSVLQSPDCVGLRIYHGVKSGRINELRLIIVGVDSKGNDIPVDKGSILALKLDQTSGALEHGQCPSCLSQQR